MRSILTVDTGGTKTRLVEFRPNANLDDSDSTKITHEVECPTPRGSGSGSTYVKTLTTIIKKDFPTFYQTDSNCIISLAIRGLVQDGMVSDQLLGWDKFPVAKEINSSVGAKVLVENDAKAGALGAFSSTFRGRGLFLTLGTGIGGGLVIDGRLSEDLIGMEIGKTIIRKDSDSDPDEWENFASGAAFHKKHDRGKEISDDDSAWQEYAEDLATGLMAIIPTIYPGEIIIGGGMSNHFPKFGPALAEILQASAWPYIAKVKLSAVNDPHFVTNRGALRLALNQTETAR